MWRVISIAAAAAVLLAGLAYFLFPGAERASSASDETSTMTVDHAAWTRLLKAYVVPDGEGLNRVDYARWKASAVDTAALDAYLAALQAVPVSRLNRDEQFAFWVNLYNALTIDVVLEHYPVSSIRDISISPGLFAIGPWGKQLVTVEGRAMSLDDIEHQTLRKDWQEPRVHYAVNCASVGCPNLAIEAYTAANLEAMLEAGARAYVNSPRGVAVENNRIVASRIYSWFSEDFTGLEGGLVGHLKRYAEGDRLAALERLGRVSDYRYDWALNDTQR